MTALPGSRDAADPIPIGSTSASPPRRESSDTIAANRLRSRTLLFQSCIWGIATLAYRAGQLHDDTLRHKWVAT